MMITLMLQIISEFDVLCLGMIWIITSRKLVCLIGIVLFVMSPEADHIDEITERPGWFIDHSGKDSSWHGPRYMHLVRANRRRHREDSPYKPNVDQDYFKTYIAWGRKKVNWCGTHWKKGSFELKFYTTFKYMGTVCIRKIEFRGNSGKIKKGDILIVWLNRPLDLIVPTEAMKCMGFVRQNGHGHEEFVSLNDQVDDLGRIWRVVPEGRSYYPTKFRWGMIVFECKRDLNSGFCIDDGVRFDFKTTSDQSQHYGVFAFGVNYWNRVLGEANCDFLLPRTTCRDLVDNEVRGLKIARSIRL